MHQTDHATTYAEPAHIPFQPADRPYWDHVLHELGPSAWTKHKLDIAALLARTMADLEAEQSSQRLEGSLIQCPNGQFKPSPRNRVVKNLVGQIAELRRSLGLPGSAPSFR